MTIEGAITETDIANYLANTPGFFERHAELLASIQLTSPHGQRAVSLQERQMEMLREKIRGLEHRIIEMIRHGNENMAIADRLHRYTRAIMLVRYAGNMPEVLLSTLKHEFMIPQATLRLWGMDEAYDDLTFTQGVSEDTKAFVGSLALPYCGLNSGFEAVGWLEDTAHVQSVALIPLRGGLADEPFGLLVLGSPDPTRYTAEMGTDFLVRIGEVAGAGLSRLLPMN
ncbi:DUF484 family protein [Ideonella sp. DXS22W]|uniref:DUF484 family protein n=1 Tax=Pseudaquabacterium inlustre TaxID=2984192 RepID=A0ABU9CH33_9BURK